MRLIDAEAEIGRIRKRICGRCMGFHADSGCGVCSIKKIISGILNAPAIEVVPKELYEQILWERNIAMEQLEEHGIGFASKKE